ncbi:hypothetical protein [Nocardia sp. NPDC057440]|uniref:hypothetical protein n=1 Tax=Nocardia sp. NPDC057440 TaxID=3346134 RepID=UPI00366F2E77
MQLHIHRVGDILNLERRPAAVDPEGVFREVGLRSFGRGLFHKDPVSGVELGSKRVFHIHPGDLLFSNVFAWEGAVAIATENEDGLIGSHRFMTYRVDESQADIRYLCHYFASGPGQDAIRTASPGSAGRNRTLGINSFAAQEIRLPSKNEQQRIADKIDNLLRRVNTVDELRRTSSSSAAQKLPLAGIDRLLATFADGTTTVSNSCDIVNNTIHPGMDCGEAQEFVGLEHIESNSGRRIGGRPLGDEKGRKLRFQPGDILFGYLRPYLNKVWVADKHGLCSVEQYVLRPNGTMSAELIAAALRGMNSLTRTTELTHNLQLPRLRSGLLMSMEIPFIPADREKQALSELSNYMSKSQRYIDLLKHRDHLSTALRASVLNAAFAGKL